MSPDAFCPSRPLTNPRIAVMSAHPLDAPADRSLLDQFLRAWDASFDWPMMHYPVLSRVAGTQQWYLQGNRLQTRGHALVQRRELAREQLAERLASDFGIDVRLVQQALQILRRQGEPYG
jgi:hypothetical protein